MSDPSSQAHYRWGTNLLWDQEELLVYFMNPEKFTKEIPCDTIIKWMNEWRGGEDNDASSVPKFVRSENQNHSDIRVQFDGMYIHTTYIERQIFSPNYSFTQTI